MKETHSCQSCGMSISAGAYCEYCVDETGQLQSFDERLERMIQWTLNEYPGFSRQKAEEEVKAYMKTMPAWKDHPNLMGN